MNLKIADAVLGAMAGVAFFIVWLGITGTDASMVVHLIGIVLAVAVTFGVWVWLRSHSAQR